MFNHVMGAVIVNIKVFGPWEAQMNVSHKGPLECFLDI